MVTPELFITIAEAIGVPLAVVVFLVFVLEKHPPRKSASENMCSHKDDIDEILAILKKMEHRIEHLKEMAKQVAEDVPIIKDRIRRED